MGILKRIWGWFDDRLGISAKVEPVMHHPVPPEVASNKRGWVYAFGNATLVAFLLQMLTGAALATNYIPAAAHAYGSLLYINEQVLFGRVLRGMHFFGASAMVLLISLHMVRILLTASYKFPRELNWLSGVGLLVLTMLMAFTGQLLRWDENGVWSVVVAAQFAGRVPLIGNGLARFILAGDTLGGWTLSRFFVFHVFLIPGTIIGILAIHLYLVLHHGISELPRAGRVVDPQRYRAWYATMLKERGRPYWPDVIWREAAVAVGMILVILVLAIIFGARGPGPPPDPTRLAADPRPDWFLLWYYALLAYKPRGLEDLVMVYAPLLLVLLLILLPFIANRGERSPMRRPWAIALVLASAIGLGMLTAGGIRAPWVPAFDTEPVPVQAMGLTDPQVQTGAQLFYDKACQFCHVVAGRGGDYGPELTGVHKRLSEEEITSRIINGIGNMPAYRDNLTVEELDAIVAFLVSLNQAMDGEAAAIEE